MMNEQSESAESEAIEAEAAPNNSAPPSPKSPQRLWLWGLLSFLVGSSIFMLIPQGWLFIDHTSDEQHSLDSEKREIWACPMLCVKLDHGGECPVCGMDLELLEDTGDVLKLNARERRVIDLQTVLVEEKPLTRSLRSFGRLTFNQRRVKRITAWVPGRITRLFADTTYTDVREGDHLFEIYSPTLFSAQSEYLSARRSGGNDRLFRSLVESSREKLQLYGMSEAQIKELEETKEAKHTIVINASTSGTIFELHLREGDYVKEGTPLYTIADYTTLWLIFDAYERDLPWIAPGQKVSVTLDAHPGRNFGGTVEFLERAVDEKTRTVKVRVVMENKDWALKPGMFASVEIEAILGADGKALRPGLSGRYSCYMHPEIHLNEPGICPICEMPVDLIGDNKGSEKPKTPPKHLSIPSSAVLDTGERQIVYVMSMPPKWAEVDGVWRELHRAQFERAEVTLGPRAGNDIAVLSGLKKGDRVVTHGNFLIDSQMELLGKPSLMHSQGGEIADPHAGH